MIKKSLKTIVALQYKPTFRLTVRIYDNTYLANSSKRK